MSCKVEQTSTGGSYENLFTIFEFQATSTLLFVHRLSEGLTDPNGRLPSLKRQVMSVTDKEQGRRALL